MIPVLKVTVSKTVDGKSDYMQILHGDAMTANIVLIADRIEINDVRRVPQKRRGARR